MPRSRLRRLLEATLPLPLPQRTTTYDGLECGVDRGVSIVQLGYGIPFWERARRDVLVRGTWNDRVCSERQRHDG